METLGFEEVDESYRSEGTRRRRSKLLQALVDGKTVRVVSVGGTLFYRLRMKGLALHQHQTEEGYVLWATPLTGSEEQP